MGIHGLTSFVDHRCKAFLQQEHIDNCYLIIDGDNVSHHIFKRKPRFSAHGTEYLSYASEVESFFLDLKSCGISPVVVVDGARDVGGAKLPKQLSRLSEKVRRSVRAAASQGRPHEDIFPPLARNVFVQVARRVSVPVAQCPREADGCAAALARRLGCSVLSGDSDLWVLGVPVVRLTPWQRPCTAPRAARTAARFINCVVFRPQRLLQHYGIAAPLLPLLATLLGNDLVPPAVLEPFYRRLYTAQGLTGGRPARPGQRIKALLRWLATQTSPREALDKVLSTLPEKDRDVVEAHSALVTASIADDSFEFLRSALPELYRTLLERAPSAEAPPPPELPEMGRLLAPDAVLPVCVLDAAGGSPALLEPAVEVLTEPAAALTAASLLARLASLLAGRPRRLTLYVRQGREVAQRTAAADQPVPAADPACSEARLLAVLGVRRDALTEVPVPLRLLAAALICWRRATAGRSGRRAVRAALLTCAALAPADTLPVPTESAAGWRENTAPLRQRPAARPPPAAVHLYYELQYVLLVALAANEALGRPLGALDVDSMVHGPLAIGLGFCALSKDEPVSGFVGRPDPQPDADMERLISRLTDIVETEAAESCLPSLTPGGSRASAADWADAENAVSVEGGAASSVERLSQLVTVAGVTRRDRGRKRPRQQSRTRHRKRSRR